MLALQERGQALKRVSAIIGAALVTALIAFGMLVVGASAVFNPNSVPVSDSPVSSAPVSDNTSTDPQAEIRRLQSLVSQYQSREQQYQAQVNQLSQQLQQDQNILVQLQQRGIIRIGQDGSIQLRRGF